MPHVVLLGDSIFDNAAYTKGGPAVIDHLRSCLPAGWQCTLAAVDGSTTAEVGEQLARLPDEATHLVLSVGGNDAMMRADLLDTPVASTATALVLLADAMTDFEASYRAVVDACLARRFPLTVCTIYNGCFPDPVLQRRTTTAIALFDDVILRTASRYDLEAIDLRLVCDRDEDYANPIEPSTIGGEKIARAITRVLAGGSTGRAR